MFAGVRVCPVERVTVTQKPKSEMGRREVERTHLGRMAGMQPQHGELGVPVTGQTLVWQDQLVREGREQARPVCRILH